MKTNHQRAFKAKQDSRDQSFFAAGSLGELSNKLIKSKAIGNDFTNGKHGMASAKRGAKKFVRSRVRFHENSETKKISQDLDFSQFD